MNNHENQFVKTLLETLTVERERQSKVVTLNVRTTSDERDIFQSLDEVSYLRRGDLVVAAIRLYYDNIIQEGPNSLNNHSIAHLRGVVDSRKTSGVKDTSVSLRLSKDDEDKLKTIASTLGVSKANAIMALVLQLFDELCMKQSYDYMDANPVSVAD